MEERILILLEEMSKDIKDLKGDVSTLKDDVSTLKGDVSTLKDDVSTLKSDVSDIKHKLDAVYDQTANLTEFKTDVSARLQRIENGIEVLVKEDFNNKVEIVELKKKIAV